MRRLRALAGLVVVAGCATAAWNEELPAGLTGIDRVFGELESLEGELERCIEQKVGTARAFAAADKAEIPPDPIPEPAAAPPRNPAPIAGAEERRKVLESAEAIAACRSSFAINFQDKDFAEFLRSDNNDEILASHGACLAFAEKSPAGCDKLKEAGFEGPVRECRLAYAVLSLVRALASGDPRAAALCLEAAAAPGEKAVSSARSCAGLVARKDAEVCPKAALAQEKYREHECVIAFGLSGRPDACSVFDPLRDGWEERSCLDYAAYVKALAAGDPALCGERPLCRALMGEGAAACRAILARIGEKFCARMVFGPEISTNVVTRAEEEAVRQRRIRLWELAREQEREALAEKRRVTRGEGLARIQARRNEALSRFNEISEACLRTSKSLQDRVDKAYELLTLFEPKGHPGHKSRLVRFFEAQSRQAQRLERLQSVRIF